MIPNPFPELLYRLYSWRLGSVVDDGPMPQHVGVILDGNRRFAREKGLSTAADGHRAGAEKIPELLDWCDELGIRYVTLWLLSTDNLSRESEELDELVTIIVDSVRSLTAQKARWPGVSINGVGATEAIPEALQSALDDAQRMTSDGNGLHVQIAVGYGGRREVIDALRRYLHDQAASGATLDDVIENLSVDAISNNLYSKDVPDPDLIIRTSGEIRLSGFMLWQSAHSEFYFCDPYWPAFRRIDFLRALREFQGRTRRFGK